MSENYSRSENELNPSDKYLLGEIEKMKTELNQLKNLKDQTFQTTKSIARKKPARKRVAVKRKPARKRVVVKRK